MPYWGSACGITERFCHWTVSHRVKAREPLPRCGAMASPPMLTTSQFQVQTGFDSKQNQIRFGEKMDNIRYDYDPIVTRKRLEWPNNARVALWVCPNIEYFHIDKPILES